MIPIKLEIQGVYSYKNKVVIDFERLIRNRIFGIFGNTGSGKSSIVEAMIFALYGKAERLDATDKYNFLNLDSNKFSIDFTFEHDDKRYKCVVSGERDPKDSNKVGIKKRATYVLQNQESPTDKLPKDIIGIDYENFRKIIVIPQGKFLEFLSLTPKEKAEVMKKLFNLEKYDLYEKVRLLEEKNNEAINTIEGQLREIGQIDEEEKSKLEKEKINLDEKIKSNNEILKKKEEEQRYMQKNKEIIEKLNAQEQIYHTLKEKENFYKNKKENLEIYKKIKLNFETDIFHIRNKEKEKDEINKEIEKVKEELEKKENEFTTENEKFKNLKISYEKRDEIKQEAENINILLNIREIEDEYKKSNEIYKSKSKEYENVELLLTNKKAERENEIKKLKELENIYSNKEILVSIDGWFKEKKLLEDQFNEKEKEFQLIKKKIEELEKKRKSIINSVKDKFQQEKIGNKEDIEKIRDKIKIYIEKIEKNIEECEEKINKLTVKTKLEEYAKELKEGSPCPLCGSLHHPQPLNITNVQNELYIYKQKKEEYKSQKKYFEDSIEYLNKNISEIEKIDASKENFSVQVKNSEEKFKQIKEKIDQHESKFIWNNDYRDEEKLKKELENITKVGQEIKKIKEHLDRLDNEIKNLESERNNLMKEKDEIERKITEMESKIRTFKTQISLNIIEKYKDTPTEILKEKISLLNEKYKNVEKEYSDIDIRIKNLSNDISKINGKKETYTNNINKIENELENLYKNLKDKISKFMDKNIQSIEDIEKILSKKPNIENEENEIKAFEEEFLKQKNLYENLQNQARNIGYKIEELNNKIEELNEYIEKIKEENKKNYKKLGEIENMLKNIEKKIERKKALENEKKKKLDRAENINILKTMFKGDGFVKFVSYNMMKEICQYANERFHKKLFPNFEIDIDENSDNNEFIVKDIWNSGKIRSIDSLSGGEKFLVALSLSLSLSEMVQHSKNKQNFFFIDEGFGNLDKELLSNIIQILKNLTKENLIIGIISHVSELKENIDDHIIVEKDETNGSFIRNL